MIAKILYSRTLFNTFSIVLNITFAFAKIMIFIYELVNQNEHEQWKKL